MALRINKIESIVIMDIGTEDERMIVNYKLDAEEYPDLIIQRSALVNKPMATDSFGGLKQRIVQVIKAQHSIL